VLADAHGACIHLFERECSIQRRHQKIVEESPSTALSPQLRGEMGDAAVRLAQAAGYRNAGTLEFMLDEQGRAYFLEMNTRLQVEHPVTELVAGVDLVQLQIAIAAGVPLPFAQADLSQRGHAIEARIYAEDPATFLPATGRVALFAPADGPGIRNDAGIESGDEVSIYYDSMLAKLIVSAPDRASALARLCCALDDYTVLGVTTNLPLLRAIVTHPDFAAGATHTDFLDLAGLLGASFETGAVPAEILIAAAISDLQAPISNLQASGPWRVLNDGIRLRYTFGDTEQIVVAGRAAERWRVEVGDVAHLVSRIAWQSRQLTLDLDGRRVERFLVVNEREMLLIGWRGASYRLGRAGALSVDALSGRVGHAHGHTSLEAPMPGTMIKVLVEEGQAVVARQPLVVLEAMKMEHVVVAPYDGVVVKLPFRAGDLVAKGVALVELEETNNT
jgi:3-methylcrotonyl-CoA carboxylase alpha subunit